MSNYDVLITRKETTVIRVQAKNKEDAISEADDYITYLSDEEEVEWKIDYDYDFMPVKA